MPFATPISELGKVELAVYRDWFIATAPHRARVLDEEIARTAGFEVWTGAPTVDSLEVASRWLTQQVVRRWPRRNPSPTDELVSMSWDVGLHLANVLIADQAWQWRQYTASRRIVDYGHMVVTAPNGVFRNTLRQANVIVERIHDGRWGAGDMLAQYRYAVSDGSGL